MQPPHRGLVVAVAAAVFGLAVAARLYPLLRGGGLFGLGNYDDGVHYAAAASLARGAWPYRDFLLLQPPGIVVLLLPFAGLGTLVGDPTGFALARLAWMALGGLNALLVGRLLLRLGTPSALVGAVGYAVFFPAVYSEHTVLLEAPASTGLLVSLVLVRAFDPQTPSGRWRMIAAGVFLGATITLKIWGIVPVLVVVAWLLLQRRTRDALRYLAGGAGVCVVLCLPFFVGAPGAMWRMVVIDQLGRGRLNRPWALKLSQLTGVSPWTDSGFGWSLVVVLLVAAAATVWALRDRRTRLVALLLLATVGLLLSAPSWFLHYPALAAPVAVLVVAAAVGALARTLHERVGRALGAGVVALTVLVAVLSAYPLLGLTLADRFPGASLARALADLPGCVAADDPTVLIETDLIGRNLERGCLVLVDPGGVSYDIAEPGQEQVPRARNTAWQAFYLAYFRAADAVVPVRYTVRFGLSQQTADTVEGWPVVVRVGGVTVRTPQPAR